MNSNKNLIQDDQKMDRQPPFARAFGKATRYLFAAGVILASGLASAGINTWSSVGPDGGEIVKAAYNTVTPTTVYAIAASGFHRSTDAGATWQLTKKDFLNAPADMEVDPADPSRVYVSSDGPQALWVSTDSGITFSAITSFPNVGNIWQFELSANGQTIYATSGARVFRSDNRGTSWTERTSVGLVLIRRLLVDPTDKETVYAVADTSSSNSGFFVTHDGAASWGQLNAAAPAGYIYDIAIPATNPNRIWIGGEHGLYVSSNAGANFSLNYSPAISSTARVIAINPADSTNLYIGEPYGFIYKTTNEGATWTNVSGNVPTGLPSTIAIRPQSPSHILVGGFSGLALSTSGGTTWARRDTGIIATRVHTISADPAADRIYLSAGGTGIHSLAGGAASSTPVNNPQLAQLTQIPTSFFVTSVLAQSSPSGRVFAGVDNRIARSLDGGATWALTTFPLLPGHQATVMTSSPLNPQVILAGLTSSLYRSADGGDTWAPATSGLPANAYVDSVAFSASDPLIAYAAPKVFTSGATQSFGIYRSGDGGLTWSPANAGIESLGAAAVTVHPLDPQIVYISGDTKLWRTTNGGASWTALPWDSLRYQNPTAIALDPVRPSALYVSGPQVIFRSIDSGDSWELLTPPFPSPTPWITSALLPDPLRPHVILAATYRFGAQQITIAPDLALQLDSSPATQLTPGQAVTFRYTALNLGPFHATGAKVHFQIPTSLQNVSIETSPGTCSGSAPTIACTYDILRAGLSALITLKGTAATEGALQLTGSIEGDQADSASANNTNSYSATVAAAANVSVTATGTANAQVGSAVTHTLTVQNAGPNIASAVQLTHQIGTGLTLSSATATVGTCAVNGANVTCNLGDLAASATATVTVQANAAAAGAAVSNATVSTSTADPSTANNSASITTTVTAVPASPPPSAPAASGGGGGGSLSFLWVWFLGILAAWRAIDRGSERLAHRRRMPLARE